MASVLKVNQIQLPDGSAPTAADLGLDVSGSVVQVVKTNLTALPSVAVTTTGYVDLMSVNITPKYSDSILLIMFDCFLYTAPNVTGYLAVFDSGNNSISGYWTQWAGSTGLDQHIEGHCHWSPNSTTQQTIKLRGQSSASQTIFGGNRQATLTVIEIAQ